MAGRDYRCALAKFAGSYTVDAVTFAAFLGVSEGQVIGWLAAGRLPKPRRAKVPRWHALVLERWVEEQREPTRTEATVAVDDKTSATAESCGAEPASSTTDATGTLTVSDLAAMLQVGTRTVWTWRATGVLPPPIHVGRVVRWRRDTIEAWLDQHQEQGRDR